MSEPTADDLADVVLPHMPHSHRVIGRLSTTEPFSVSPEAESFIESAKILAEPYEERIAVLTAERDKAREECGAEKRTRASLSAELSTFVRLRRDAVAERDAAMQQIARVRALCDRNAPAVNPSDPRNQDRLPYMEGFDDAVDLMHDRIRAALDDEATP